jgi:hypothetical protein
LLCDCGILYGTRNPVWDEQSFVTLALTPGMPIEWIVHCSKIGKIRGAELKRITADLIPSQAALDNAASVTPEDAWRMLEVMPRNYRGQIPLYAQLVLKEDPRPSHEIGKQLKVPDYKIQRWRRATIFDPLTGARIR